MEPHVTKILHHLTFAELEAYITAYHGPDDEIDSVSHLLDDGRTQTDGRMAVLCGVDRVTVNRWRKQGVLTVKQADRAAIGLNVNPSNIWTDSWHADIDPQLVMDDQQWEQAKKDRATHQRKIRQQRQEQT